MHGVGFGLRQVQLTDLLANIIRDKLNGRLHFGHHTLGFLDAIQTRLAEAFVLGESVNRVDLLVDITGNELAVLTYSSLHIDKVVSMADDADALAHLLFLLGEALLLLASRLQVLLRFGLIHTAAAALLEHGLLQACPE